MVEIKTPENTWMECDNHSGYLLWNFLWLVNVVFFDAVICWVSFLLVVFGFLFLVVGNSLYFWSFWVYIAVILVQTLCVFDNACAILNFCEVLVGMRLWHKWNFLPPSCRVRSWISKPIGCLCNSTIIFFFFGYLKL